MPDQHSRTALDVRTDDGELTIGTASHPDWFGPATIDIGADVTFSIDVADETTVLLRLQATSQVSARSDGGFADVRAGLRFDPSRRTAGDFPAGLRAFGHQYTEFGLPTQASETLDRWFLLPFRPNVVLPLWLCDPEGPSVLLAPVDSFHEQVITVPTPESEDRRLVWGWHGDLDDVPSGFTSTLAVLSGDSPRELLERWSSMLEIAPRHPVDHDALGRRVSYWTDNGAAYWYRTESPRSVTETLRDAVAAAESAAVPIGSLQLDSWFYPHETTRPFDTDEWVVPPSGLIDWAPRADILPDGMAPIRDAVDGRPLITHCRHLSKQSPLVDQFACWVDEEYAHPTGADYYEEFLDRASSWGVETFEHDWLVECFLGVRGLRAAPGRARAWQEGIDRAAADRSMTLQWCMATPADFFQTASLGQVTSIRTSGDHGYLVGPGFLWAWFCYTNALARVLGLAPFKDVFSSGDEHGEIEALLSALSTGPVGLGDAIGTTDPAVVLPTCRADGTIIRPDVPIAAVDACFRRHAVAQPVPLVAECHTDHDAGRWTQVFCANTFRGDEPISGTVDLGPAWPNTDVVALDLRTGEVTRPSDGWDVALDPAAWTHHLLAPIVDGIAVFGDTSKHAPVGKARLSSIERGDGLTLHVLGDGEQVTIEGWADHVVTATVDGQAVDVRSADDRWSLTVTGGTVITIR